MLPLALLFAVAAFGQSSFWDAKPPKDWSEEELGRILANSPWAREEGFLASAKIMQDAEDEWRRRHISKRTEQPEPAENDYAEFVKNNPGKHVILAVRIEAYNDFLKAEETREMEKSCVLKAGKQKLRLVGHFPPSSADPYLRLVFPRPATVEKNLRFELYLPGVSKPYRELEFYGKEMTVKGALQY